MARGHLIERVRATRREYYRSISRMRTLETEGVVTRPQAVGSGCCYTCTRLRHVLLNEGCKTGVVFCILGVLAANATSIM
jgi:hypothetical protein